MTLSNSLDSLYNILASSSNRFVSIRTLFSVGVLFFIITHPFRIDN